MICSYHQNANFPGYYNCYVLSTECTMAHCITGSRCSNSVLSHKGYAKCRYHINTQGVESIFHTFGSIAVKQHCKDRP